jgi:uncharacterized protein YneF (UPF0154 family)
VSEWMSVFCGLFFGSLVGVGLGFRITYRAMQDSLRATPPKEDEGDN